MWKYDCDSAVTTGGRSGYAISSRISSMRQFRRRSSGCDRSSRRESDRLHKVEVLHRAPEPTQPRRPVRGQEHRGVTENGAQLIDHALDLGPTRRGQGVKLAWQVARDAGVE